MRRTTTAKRRTRPPKQPTAVQLEARYAKRSAPWLRDHVASTTATIAHLRRMLELVRDAQTAYEDAWQSMLRRRESEVASIDVAMVSENDRHQQASEVIDRRRSRLAKLVFARPNSLLESTESDMLAEATQAHHQRMSELRSARTAAAEGFGVSPEPFLVELAKLGLHESYVPVNTLWRPEKFHYEYWPQILDRLASVREFEERRLELATVALARATRHEQCEAVAAAHFGRTRQRAAGVKREIKRQLSYCRDCPYCGGPLAVDDASICADHIYPVARGGLSVDWNMVYVCGACNAAKGSLTLRDFVRQRQLPWPDVERRLSALGKQF